MKFHEKFHLSICVKLDCFEFILDTVHISKTSVYNFFAIVSGIGLPHTQYPVVPNTSGCGGNSEIRPQNWPHSIPQAGSHWQTCCSPVTSGPAGLETCVDAENSLCIEDSATGDLMVSSWTGLSGVPGLGVSVPSRPGKTCNFLGDFRVLRGLNSKGS